MRHLLAVVVGYAVSCQILLLRIFHHVLHIPRHHRLGNRRVLAQSCLCRIPRLLVHAIPSCGHAEDRRHEIHLDYREIRPLDLPSLAADLASRASVLQTAVRPSAVVGSVQLLPSVLSGEL